MSKRFRIKEGKRKLYFQIWHPGAARWWPGQTGWTSSTGSGWRASTRCPPPTSRDSSCSPCSTSCWAWSTTPACCPPSSPASPPALSPTSPPPRSWSTPGCSLCPSSSWRSQPASAPSQVSQ